MTKVVVETLPHSPSPDGLPSQQAKTLAMQLTENIKSLKRQLETCQAAVQELQRGQSGGGSFDTSEVSALVEAAEDAAEAASGSKDAAAASAAAAEGSAASASQSAASAVAAKDAAETSKSEAAESASSAEDAKDAAVAAKDAAEAAAESVTSGGSEVSFVIANMAYNGTRTYSISSLVPADDPADATYTVTLTVNATAAVASNNFSFENVGHALTAYSVSTFSAGHKAKTGTFAIKVNSSSVTALVTISREEA